MQAFITSRVAKKVKSKFALFSWENIKRPAEKSQELLRDCDLLIAGNKDAYNIMKPYAKKIVILPQVGIRTNYFNPLYLKKKYDFIYAGRFVPEKGCQMILDSGLNVVFVHNVAYKKLREKYNESRFFVSYPYDTSDWHEQGGYAYLEALSCGIPVICSNAGNLPQWLKDCEGVIMIPQNEPEKLKETMENALTMESGQYAIMSVEARRWVIENYDNEVIAKKLVEAMKDA